MRFGRFNHDFTIPFAGGSPRSRAPRSASNGAVLRRIAQQAARPLRRLAWATMALGHTPALLATWADGGDSGVFRALLLALTQLFFVLKVVDVRWLRIPPTPRAWIAFVVGVALLHANVAARTVSTAATDPLVYQAALLGGVAAVSLIACAADRTLGNGRGRARRQRGRSLIRQHLCHFADTLLPPRDLRLTRACAVNRAPPA